MNSPDDKLWQAMRFDHKVIFTEGQSYEDLFTKIMRDRYADFRQVKPNGRDGDWKNDGFIPSSGKCFQVYAPEDAELADARGAEKVVNDFKGLLEKWGKVAPVKLFRFAANDKFRGLGPKCEAALAQLRKDHPSIDIASFLAHELREEFLQTGELVRYELFGSKPPDVTSEDLETRCFQQVLDHLLQQNAPVDFGSVAINPDFEAKLQFNNLSEPVATHLRSANYDGSAYLVTFFKFKSREREKLAHQFRRLYRETSGQVGDVPGKENVVFLEILAKATPVADARVQHAALVLMSYFFEVCDIFEPPR
jgi:hypothetical protein